MKVTDLPKHNKTCKNEPYDFHPNQVEKESAVKVSRLFPR